MAFPLAALGAGLGQFAQDYRQQQESALRQMAAEFQLNLLRQKQQDEQLLGAAALGGKIPGFGPMNIPGQQQPMQGLPQAPGAMPQAAASPQQPQVPPGMMRTPTGGIMPQGDYLTPEQDTAPATPSPSMSIAPGMIGPGGVIPLDTNEPPAAAAQDGAIPLDSATAAATPASATPPRVAGKGIMPPGGLITPDDYARYLGETPAQPSAATPAPSAAIDTPDEFSQYLGMFRQADPSAIAQHIKSVRPSADEGAVWRATATLMKMASGNVREQLGAASMMKFLIGEKGRTERAGLTSDDRAAGRASREGIAAAGRELAAGKAVGSIGGRQTVADKNAETAAGNLAARKEAQAALQQWRKDKESNVQGRFDSRQIERVTASAPKAAADAIKLMARRHGLLKSHIDAIDMSVDAVKPEKKKERDQIFREMQDLESRIDARVQAIEKATPVAE